MAKIYISSTYEDLKDYREAANKAVRKLGHHAICMEDYVARDKRSVQQCLEDVRNCDLYIGIIAWRYGHVPDESTKSITHLEYEAAVKAKKPRLIFLHKDENKQKKCFVEKGDKRKAVDAFREQALKDRMEGRFNNPTELYTEVIAALALYFIKKFAGEVSNLKFGQYAHRMCDRKVHCTEFEQFFFPNIKTNPGIPHFYFIPGDSKQCHDGFTKHIEIESLKTYLKYKNCQGGSKIKHKKVTWPNPATNFELQKGILKRELIRKFELNEVMIEFCGKSFVKSNKIEKEPMIICSHTITSAHWDKNTTDLIRWYIEDFWGNLDLEDNGPILLVFFCIVFNDANELGFFRRIASSIFSKKNLAFSIKEQLTDLSHSLPKTIPCKLLDELLPVEILQVAEWFEDNEIFDDYFKCQTFAEECLGPKSHKYDMFEVEAILQKFIKENRPKLEKRI